MIYAYYRVSTNKQDFENQKQGVINFCKRKDFIIDKEIIDEGVSGIKEPEKRLLGRILKIISNGDIIVCSELSRLGRKLFMIMRILEHCMQVGAKVYTVKDNYELGDNIQSKVLAFAFGLSAEIERNLISERTKEALFKKKQSGVILGRPSGSKNSSYKLDGKNYIIKDMLSKNISKSKIAKKLKVCRFTLNKFINENKIDKYL